MTPEDLKTALDGKLRDARVDADDTACAARRAAAEVADTQDTIANAVQARLPGHHIDLLRALMEPDQSMATAADLAADAATGRREAAARAVADVGGLHLELQAAGAAGEFYQGRTPAPAAPKARGLEPLDENALPSIATYLLAGDIESEIWDEMHEEGWVGGTAKYFDARDRRVLERMRARLGVLSVEFRLWYRSKMRAENDRLRAQARMHGERLRREELMRTRRTARNRWDFDPARDYEAPRYRMAMVDGRHIRVEVIPRGVETAHRRLVRPARWQPTRDPTLRGGPLDGHRQYPERTWRDRRRNRTRTTG